MKVKSLSKVESWTLRLSQEDSRQFELRFSTSWSGGWIIGGHLRGRVAGLARSVGGDSAGKFRTITSESGDNRAAAELVDRIGTAMQGTSEGVTITERMQHRAIL